MSHYVVPEIEDEVTCWLLAQHPEASIRAYAVASPHADDSVIELLLEDDSPMVVQAAVYHPRLPHTPAASAAARKNDDRITKAIFALNPPSRETILWLYQSGGRMTKAACLRLISQDRGLVMTALRDGVLLDYDVRVALNGGNMRPEDHDELATSDMTTVRAWVVASTSDPRLLQQLADDPDSAVSTAAVRRIEALAAKRSLF